MNVSLLDLRPIRELAVAENDLRTLAVDYAHEVLIQSAVAAIAMVGAPTDLQFQAQGPRTDGPLSEIRPSIRRETWFRRPTIPSHEQIPTERFDTYLTVSFSEGMIAFRLEDLEERFGSYGCFKRVWVKVLPKKTKAWIGSTMTLLFVGITVNGLTAPPNPERNGYYCSVGVFTKGNVQQLVSDAADDLEMPAHPSSATQKLVWRARQACLASLGIYHGPIDGIEGERTRAAENALTARYGSINLNWRSQVFREFVVREAMKRGPA